MGEKRIKAVIFDYDGTLIDSSVFVEALAATIKVLGLTPLSKERLEKIAKLPFDEYLPLITPPEMRGDEKFVEGFIREYRRIYGNLNLKHVKPFQGVPLLLRKLSTGGFLLGVATGRKITMEHVEEELRHLGLRGFINELVTFIDLKGSKIDLIAECMKRLNVRGEECIVVGDSPEDIEAGKRLRAKTIGAVYGFYGRGLIDAHPDFIAYKPLDILNICRKLRT